MARKSTAPCGGRSFPEPSRRTPCPFPTSLSPVRWLARLRRGLILIIGAARTAYFDQASPGPCSELYYDRGPDYGPEGGPAVDEDRFMEYWNLVFMQYEMTTFRTKEDFDLKGGLPAKNIDTGM